MSPVQTVTHVSGPDKVSVVAGAGFEPTTPSLRIVFDPALTMLDGICPGCSQFDNTLIRNDFLFRKRSTSYERVARPLIPLPY